MRIVEDGAPTHERDLVDECHLVRGSRSESETAGEFPEPRAQLQALVPRRDHNLGAGPGIGLGLVVLELETQVSADVGQSRRLELPGLSSELDGALKSMRGQFQARLMTALIQHRAVKAGIVRRQELHTLEQRGHLMPEVAKPGRAGPRRSIGCRGYR